MKIAVTARGVAHAIRDNPDNGYCGYWQTKCGQWVSPPEIRDDLPHRVKLCKQCRKEMENE